VFDIGDNGELDNVTFAYMLRKKSLQGWQLYP
jgi:hypothetical protein